MTSIRPATDDAGDVFARTLLEARADTAPAPGFHRSEGLSEIGRRRSYYTDGTDAVVMQR